MSKGVPKDIIKKEVLNLVKTPLWYDVITLFKSYLPLPIFCHECLAPKKLYLNPFTLEESYFCDRCERTAAQAIPERRVVLQRCGIPRIFMEAELSDFTEPYSKLQDLGGFFITGDRGVGKTHLAVALLKDSIKDVRELNDFVTPISRSSLFVSVPELLMELRWSYSGQGEAERGVLVRYTSADTLVLDDLGAEKASEWVLQMLYIIIDRRYRDFKKTIITSNLSLDEISERLGDRIASRIAGMCTIVRMDGEDRRVAQRVAQKGN